MLTVEKLPVTVLETNCYVTACTKTNETIIVDPGEYTDRIAEIVSENAIASAMTFLIPYAPRLISSPAVTHFLQATLALGALAGLSRLARRLVRPEMRVISCR